jgi:hypothetical protein
MPAFKRWGCPKCGQRSSRRWNMEVHIARAHGMGEPIEIEKSANEDTYEPSDSYKSNTNNGSFRKSFSSATFPKASTAKTSKISRSQKIFPYSDTVDRYYQMAVEFDENQKKIKKIKNVFTQFPLFTRQHNDANPLNAIRKTIEPPSAPTIASHQKNRETLPAMTPGRIIEDKIRNAMPGKKNKQPIDHNLYRGRLISDDLYCKVYDESPTEEVLRLRMVYPDETWIMERGIDGRLISYPLYTD